jgi:hypothetical protein
MCPGTLDLLASPSPPREERAGERRPFSPDLSLVHGQVGWRPHRAGRGGFDVALGWPWGAYAVAISAVAPSMLQACS